MPRRTALYLRISQDRTREELGIDRQRDACRRLAAARDLEIDEEFVDNDISASGRKVRPSFERLLQDVEDRNVGTIIALDFTRLMRTNRDKYRFLEACQAHDVNIMLARGTDIDMRTAIGRMLADTLATTARFEVEQKAERQRAQREQEASKGWAPPSRRAFGYKVRERRGQGEPVTQLDETEAPLLAEAYRMALAGRSMASIAKWLNDQGSVTTNGKPWSYHSLWYVLTNPKYKGVRGVRQLLPGRDGMDGKREKFHTETAPGSWDAIVNPDVWDAVQTILRDPRRRVNHPVNEHGARYLLPGISSCGVCGAHMITGSRVTTSRETGERVHDRLLRCSKIKHVARKAAPIEEFVEEIMLHRLSDPAAREVLRRTAAPADVDLDEVRTQMDILRARRSAITNLLAQGGMPTSEAPAAYGQIDAGMSELGTKLADTLRTDPVLELADSDDPRATWHSWPIETKRSLIAATLRVVVHSGRPGRPGGKRFDPTTVEVSWR